MFIDLFRSDLVAGYRKIKNYHQPLLSKWRFKLLRAFAQKWEVYSRQQAEYETRQRRLKQFLRWMAVILLLSGIIFCLLTFLTPFGWLGFLLWGGAGLVTLGALAVWVAFSLFKPKLPENPLAQSAKKGYTSPLKQALFPDLVPNWRVGLKAPLPSEAQVARLAKQTEKWGLIGEFDLVRGLAGAASANTLILHGLMPKPKDDLDVVLIGPKGIWYFEVKFEKAEFHWQNGTWQIWKIDYETRQRVKVTWPEYPDAQWYRMRAEVLKNLKANAQALLAKTPNAGKINGGIVFAHPRVVLNIQKSPPFVYGNLGGWMTKYRSAPNLPGMTPEVILGLAEILLAKHQSLNPTLRVTSMRAYAEAVIREAEQKLENWVALP